MGRNMTIRTILLVCLPALLGSGPALSQSASKPLSENARTSLRCAAAFAIVANDQAKGNRKALGWPPLAKRGREFFVRVSAQVMDETGQNHDAVAQLLTAEALKLRKQNGSDQIMPGCLQLLDAAGL